MKSYLDWFNVDEEGISVTVCTEGGECEMCGRHGRMFYLVEGGRGCEKVCESCARERAAPYLPS